MTLVGIYAYVSLCDYVNNLKKILNKLKINLF